MFGDGGKSQVDNGRFTEDESKDELEVRNLVKEVAVGCGYVDLLGRRRFRDKEDT